MNPVACIGILMILTILIDIPWLLYRKEYHTQFFKQVQGSSLQVRYGPALLVYLLFAMALFGYAVPSTSWKDAAKRGAMVGGIMYGFYDATNWATLRGWTTEMAIVDTLWGALAGALASIAIFYIQKKR